MRFPRKLLPLLKPSEGLAKLIRGMVYPYLCPARCPTQGYGIRVADLNVPPITPAEAEQRLANVLVHYVQEAIRLSPILAHPEYEDVLAAVSDFIYNLGAPAYAGSTLHKKINRGDWAGARRELMKWVHAGGKVQPGLVIRRGKEADLLPC